MTGQELRQLRISNRLLQRDLAALLSISERQVQRWEASEAVPAIAEYAIIGICTIHEHEDAA
jgi:DNA-binding transcriptional regulator YiaG